MMSYSWKKVESHLDIQGRVPYLCTLNIRWMCSPQSCFLSIHTYGCSLILFNILVTLSKFLFSSLSLWPVLICFSWYCTISMSRERAAEATQSIRMNMGIFKLVISTKILWACLALISFSGSSPNSPLDDKITQYQRRKPVSSMGSAWVDPWSSWANSYQIQSVRRGSLENIHRCEDLDQGWMQWKQM